MSYRTSLSRLIARRLAGSHGRATWSRPVVQIATAGVAIGIALIVIATSIVHGFQSEVKELVVGFGSDIQVLNGDWKDQKIKRQKALKRPCGRLQKFEVFIRFSHRRELLNPNRD